MKRRSGMPLRAPLTQSVRRDGRYAGRFPLQFWGETAMKKRSSAPSAKPKGTKAPHAGSVTAIIEAMGSQGHGTARIGGQKVFVPFTLPAEHVRAVRTGSNAIAVAIESPSSDRIAP